MPWQSVRVWLAPDDNREAILGLLFDGGSGGVEEKGTLLVTHFPESHDLTSLRAALATTAPNARVEIEALPDVDWAEQWKHGITAHRVGDLTVAPPWAADGDDSTIVIDPGMAFGTGEHATTRGVLRLMQPLIRAGDIVADLGAGSAVLAIAAAKLGASRVIAIEMDGEAISNAESNVARNGVQDRVHVLHGDATVLLPLVGPCRVVFANIISSVLIELLPTVERVLAPDGVAVLSGILVAERPHLLDVLSAGGWFPFAEDAEGEWWSVAVARLA